MIKKHLEIIVVLAISILLVSCTSQESTLEQNFKTGTPDVQILSFGSDAAYQEKLFKLPVELHNALGYDIKNVKVAIVGLDRNYVELTNYEEDLPMMEGKSALNANGGTERIEFEGFLKKLLPGLEKNQQDYRIFVNYDSKLEFFPTICVSASQYPGIDDGGCKAGGKMSFNGQGAPLAVTEMEIVPGQETELRLILRNRGQGEVGKITLGTATIGGRPMFCEFRDSDSENPKEGLFSKTKTEIHLVCNSMIPGTASYETPLFIELFYNYEINFKKKLEISK
ncbi:MAG: hypothetical protein KKA62_02835 [Nanoarchaeota archaeon]|nr:hypothetical protein [Nanoarchaeota archaeon]MBU1644213.1 hypothetical protein [Nanoarchaeota archaeon]MBU1976867.1 hypothetical protein [Nanoarchaeota archaeon]